LARRFTKLDVEEMDPESCKEMLQAVLPEYEKYHKVSIDNLVIDEAVDLSVKHMHDKKLPDKVIDILDSAMSLVKIQYENKVLDLDTLKTEISKQAKIPKEQLNAKHEFLNINYEQLIKEKLFGQDQAVEKLLDNVYIAKAGLKELNKPLGSYLFVGPTGVGKTELAQQLANVLSMHLLRYEMSEYMESHKVASLIGAPPGYVGYGEGDSGSGKLINDLEQYPSSVLLLDEVEKAHTDVLNILLGMMDNGMLTSSNGKIVSCRNTIIIMTSNLGARDGERNRIGFDNKPNTKASYDAVNKHFSPEFRNRLDAIIEFNRLTKKEIETIIFKFLKELNDLLEPKKIVINLDRSSIDQLIEEGFDEKMGTRPMKRLMADKIKKPLSKRIVFENLENVTLTVIHDGKNYELK